MNVDQEFARTAIKSCPPTIAQGVESTIGIRLCHIEAVQKWKAIHGNLPVRNLTSRSTAVRKTQPQSKEKYTFLSKVNHRRPGSIGAAFIDWLIANPGSNKQAMKDAGHDIKHLKWDLAANPDFFSIER